MSDTTPEPSVTPTPTPTVTPTVASKPWYQKVAHGLGMILIALSIVVALSTLVIVIMLKHDCESFWNEKCTVVAVPASISDQFSEKFYIQYNQNNPASTSTTSKPATASTVGKKK
jgi:cytochrome b561